MSGRFHPGGRFYPSGGTRAAKPTLIALLEAGESEALIFTKVDRASRCTEDFARLLRLSEEKDWRLIVI
jgi:DNA invertase Pin-like site-specific DNA recombinase